MSACGFCRFYRTNKFCLNRAPDKKSCHSFKKFDPEKTKFKLDKIYIQIMDDKSYKLFEGMIGEPAYCYEMPIKRAGVKIGQFIFGFDIENLRPITASLMTLRCMVPKCKEKKMWPMCIDKKHYTKELK